MAALTINLAQAVVSGSPKTSAVSATGKRESTKHFYWSQKSKKINQLKNKMTEHEYKVVDSMERHGGSFVQHLALLMRFADDENLKKLKATFSEYWTKYEKWAESEEND